MYSGSGEWKAFKTASVRTAKRVLKHGMRPSDREGAESDNDEPGSEAILPANKYQYEPLPPNCIRLLELLPAQKNGEVIQCQLYAIDLGESPGHYEALSYVWGDPKQPREVISVNGAALSIYETLHQILVSLRRGDSVRPLWIDAICINQDDIDERNTQVPLMRDIYKDAGRTVVWLGPPDSKAENRFRRSTEETFIMLRELAEESKAFKARAAANNPDYSSSRPKLPASLPSLSNYLPVGSEAVMSELKDKYNGDTSVFKILSCTWWHRAWTLQELVLSETTVLLRGHHEIDWVQLCAGVEYGLQVLIWPVMDSGFVLNQALVPYASTRLLQERLRLRRTHPEGFGITPAEDLLSLLLHCRHREARDPRDKIYAVLGVFRDIYPFSEANHEHFPQVAAQPDYAHPVAYVYRQISQQIIEHTGSLDILGVCPKSTRRGLPSWVTDWSLSGAAATPLMYDSMGHPRLTHATRLGGVKARFPADAVTMVLNAHELSHVVEVADVIHLIPFDLSPVVRPPPSSVWAGVKGVYNEFHGSLHSVAEYWKAIFAWADFAAEKPPTNPGAAGPDVVYWQTICAGSYLDGDVAKTDLSYRHWLENIEPVRAAIKRYKGFSSKFTPVLHGMNSSTWKGYSGFSRLLESAYERRLGRAANGWLCLLPEAAMVGDVIILADGGKVPLVLRPDGDGYNMLVGEAYIHGIMNGEAFEVEKCADIKIC